MRVMLAVAAGGALGASLRFGMSLWLVPSGPGAFPWATLLCNLTGSLALGLWLGYANRRPGLSRLWKELVGTGIIGSYTTFSTFSLELVQLIQEGYLLTAFNYFILSLIAGLTLAGSGYRLLAQPARRRKADA
ncbi:fluoride efflux transporter CrcB [Paenibacillus sp. GCM10012307]|uniref:Fluoride-specific ion channel FluC n=1 Tax=Paenibacillus roseus TaxID=2798579 RepID=A0A934MWK9_9BACL|nr:fluoride efflux transporter CrcB [Paenibacillus roseus]MBJ6363252.1 fluoride efflux transporter CrcB [Paenibacillus roseus]